MLISPSGAISNIPRQIANANTLFNVINTILFIGFIRWFARIAEKLVPYRPEKDGMIIKPKYLDESTLAVPAVALEQVRDEFGHMGHIAATMLSELPHALLERDRQHIDTIVMLDDKVDILESEIFNFLSKIRQRSLTAKESKIHQDLMTATVNLETLADVIETNLSPLAKKFIAQEREVGESTVRAIAALYKEIYLSVELAVQSVQENSQKVAMQVIRKKEIITELTEKLMVRRSEHLGRDQTIRLETARMEMSFIDKMQRTYNLARRIARGVDPISVR